MTQDEFVYFLFKYLAPWFSQDSNPVTNAILTGFGNISSFIYSLLLYANLQTRIQTSTGIFLDLTASDFFGDILIRCENETDAEFLERIRLLMFAPRVTVQNIIDRLFDLTGRVPIVYESFTDGGYYNNSFLGHTFMGGSGPYQIWITAYRPTPTIVNTSAFLNNTAFGTAMSYYGEGSAQNSCVTDEDILNTIEITKAAGIVAHTTILD